MNGYVIAFDTATEICAIGLGHLDDDGNVAVVASEDFEAPRAAMSRLLPSVVDLLEAHQLAVRDLAGIVVGRGPGSFTGVRIGVSTAKGLAHGLGVPLFGVGTLDAIACGLASRTEGLLGVVGDAMRGEVYPALFACENGRARRLGEDRVARPLAAAETWQRLNEPVLLAGNGLAKYAEVFAETMGDLATFAVAREWWVTGRGLLAVHAATLAAGTAGGGRAGDVLPIYTRLSDAEEAEGHRAGAPPSGELPESGVRGPASAGQQGSADASR